MSTETHAIKDPWFLSFQPSITAQEVKEHNGDWNLAQQRLSQQLDYIHTVEELWSTINSLPKMHQIGKGNFFIFARNNIDASYEAFPDGGRILVDTFNSAATDRALDLVFSAVIGEDISVAACDGNSVCDVLRISNRPNYQHRELVRMELWLNDIACFSAVEEYLKRRFQEAGIDQHDYSIDEDPFAKENANLSSTSGLIGSKSSTTQDVHKPTSPSDATNGAAANSQHELDSSPAKDGDVGHADDAPPMNTKSEEPKSSKPDATDGAQENEGEETAESAVENVSSDESSKRNP